MSCHFSRTTLDQSLFTWADLILPIGGDGTFLLAANLVFNSKKPIMGINSYPEKSVGYLMLSAKYTRNVPEIFKMLKAGHYDTLMRRRIRITLTGEKIWADPFHLHEKGRIVGADRYNVVYIILAYSMHLYNLIPNFHCLISIAFIPKRKKIRLIINIYRLSKCD